MIKFIEEVIKSMRYITHEHKIIIEKNDPAKIVEPPINDPIAKLNKSILLSDDTGKNKFFKMLAHFTYHLVA